jgi:hypothetical protein
MMKAEQRRAGARRPQSREAPPAEQRREGGLRPERQIRPSRGAKEASGPSSLCNRKWSVAKMKIKLMSIIVKF